MSNLEIITPDTIRSIDSATFTGSYQTVGTTMAHPVRIIKFTNNSTVFATISWDGTHDHDVLPAGSFLLLDVTGNEQNTNGFFIPVGTQFYVKGAAGTGLFYISTYYAV